MKYEQTVGLSDEQFRRLTGIRIETFTDDSRIFERMWIEDTLIKHPDIHLPGRKELQKSDTD